MAKIQAMPVYERLVVKHFLAISGRATEALGMGHRRGVVGIAVPTSKSSQRRLIHYGYRKGNTHRELDLYPSWHWCTCPQVAEYSQEPGYHQWFEAGRRTREQNMQLSSCKTHSSFGFKPFRVNQNVLRCHLRLPWLVSTKTE